MTEASPVPDDDPQDDASSAIVVIGSGPSTAAAVPMVDLFHLDGVAYQVPAEPGPASILKYMRDRQKHGQDEATINLLVSMLGERNLTVLSESPKVSDDNMADIFAIITKLAFDGIAKFRRAAGN